MVKEEVNRFLKYTNKFKKINPELLEFDGIKYVFIVENDNMNDETEVEILIRQSLIEDFHFIIVMKSIPSEPIDNTLLWVINQINDEMSIIIRVLYFDEVTENYVLLKTENVDKKVKIWQN